MPSRPAVPALLTCILAAVSLPALADGVMFVPVVEKGEVKVSSDAQQALIAWKNGRETLHVRSTYRGPAVDFTWVIPVPGRPEVKRSNWHAFKSAEKLTRPEIMVQTGYRMVSKGLGCSAGAEAQVENVPVDLGVRRLETLQIRELHVDVLAAQDGGGFVAWLRKNGYAVNDKAVVVLDAYVKKGFFFVAVKMRKSGLWARTKTRDGAVAGSLTPLAISFAAEKPFYPLAISAISSAPENELLLMTACDKRLQPVQYRTTYLAREDVRFLVEAPKGSDRRTGPLDDLDLKPAVKAAARRQSGAALIVECVADLAWSKQFSDTMVSPGSRLAGARVRVTRFHAVLTPGQMRDITFVPAEKNEAVSRRIFIDLSGTNRRGPPPGTTSAGGTVNAAMWMVTLMFAVVAAFLTHREARRWCLRAAMLAVIIALCVG